jgi:integrase
MASVSVHDRWFAMVRHPDGRTEKVKSAEYGRGRRWVARWRDPTGRQHGKAFARRHEAEVHAAKVEVDLNAGSYIDPAGGKRTFRDFTETTYLQHASIDPSTARLYRRLLRLHIYPVFGDQAIGSVRHSAAQKAVAAWDRGLGRNLSRQCQALTRAIFNMAVNDEVMARSPFARIRLPKVSVRPDRWMPESLDELMPVLDALPVDLETICTVAVGSGIRLSEILGLAVDDVDFLRGQVKVIRQLMYLPGEGLYLDDPKTDESMRTVPLPAFVTEALAARLAAHPPVELMLPWGDLDGDPTTVRLVFHNSGKPMLRTTITNRIKYLTRRGELPNVTPHLLRHLYRSLLHDAGIPQIVIDAYCGHRPVGSVGQTTYTHLMRGAAERVRNALETSWEEAVVHRMCTAKDEKSADQGG